MRIADLADALLLDLDGVVYTGPMAVPGAVAALERARGQGISLRYITNNASRTPEQVADRLIGIGVPARPEEVLTSAQAAARLLADRADVGPGAVVAVVGGPGLVQALAQQGMRVVPVREVVQRPDAIVQGFHTELGWADLAAATRWVRTGVPWVASNLDQTIPLDTGIAPGNGLLVHAVAVAAGRRPDAVAGKPEPVMFRLAAQTCGSRSPVVVGDRLDTDIAGGNAAGQTTVLVLTGVHGLLDALAADPAHRPHLLVADLGELWADLPGDLHDAAVDGRGRGCCGQSSADVRDGVRLEGAPGPDLARALLAAGWAAVDSGTVTVDQLCGDAAVRALDAALRPPDVA